MAIRSTIVVVPPLFVGYVPNGCCDYEEHQEIEDKRDGSERQRRQPLVSFPQDQVEDCDSSGVTLVKVHGPSAA